MVGVAGIKCGDFGVTPVVAYSPVHKIHTFGRAFDEVQENVLAGEQEASDVMFGIKLVCMCQYFLNHLWCDFRMAPAFVDQLLDHFERLSACLKVARAILDIITFAHTDLRWSGVIR